MEHVPIVPPITLRSTKARWFCIANLPGTILLTALSLFITLYGLLKGQTDAAFVGLIGVLLFGSLLSLLIYALRVPPTMILDRSGIQVHRLGRRYAIGWQDISYVLSVRSLFFFRVGLCLKPGRGASLRGMLFLFRWPSDFLPLGSSWRLDGRKLSAQNLRDLMDSFLQFHGAPDAPPAQNDRAALLYGRSRMSRARYCAASIVVLALGYLGTHHIAGISTGLSLVAVLVILQQSAAARLQDMNLSGRWAYLYLALPAIALILNRHSPHPLTALAFCFLLFGPMIWLAVMRGTAGQNRFGQAPSGG